MFYRSTLAIAIASIVLNANTQKQEAPTKETSRLEQVTVIGKAEGATA